MSKKTQIIIGVLAVVLILCAIFYVVKYKEINNTEENENSSVQPKVVSYKTKIEELPQDYSIEDAIKDNCVISVHGSKVYNEDVLENFLNNVNNNIADSIRSINFTIEGDMLITEINFKENNIFDTCLDWTRDKFSSEEDRTYKYQQFSTLVTDEIDGTKEIYLKNSDTENNNELYIIYYQTDAEIINKENVVLTLDDEIKDNSIWCGTFQLIWNDLKNDLAKKDIVFTPQLKVVENLNKETFKAEDLTDKYYYKVVDTPSLALKNKIEKAIKEKFNETSDILDDFSWENRDPEDYFLYAMLKKEFKFEKAFEELENGEFGNYKNIKYFGTKSSNKNEELRNQVDVLYYNSKDDFAIKLKTKQEDEVILCKNPEGNTFNEIYQKIKEQENSYKGNKNLEEGELLKIPNIKINEKTEFTEIQNKPFLFSNGDLYKIEKAIQTIKFELDKTGGKIKSEAGMMVKKEAMAIPMEKREFAIDNTFAIYLKENGKDTPYFAGKISDITKFQ